MKRERSLNHPNKGLKIIIVIQEILGLIVNLSLLHSREIAKATPLNICSKKIDKKCKGWIQKREGKMCLSQPKRSSKVVDREGIRKKKVKELHLKKRRRGK